MININSYFEIDWDATMKNLKTLLLEYTSYPVLAEALHVEAKTISNWLNNRTKPELSVLIIFARFLNMDLLDVIITKGDSSLTEEIVRSAMDEANSAKELLSRSAKKDCSCPEEFISTTLFYEYYTQKTSLRYLDEFLIYLPLFDLDIFQDVFHRLQGNLGSNQFYVLKKLRDLYDHIPESPAKCYADAYCYYHLTTPTVHQFTVQERQYEKGKWQQYLNWINSAEAQKEKEDYETACKIFQNKLMTYNSIKRLLERITEDDYL